MRGTLLGFFGGQEHSGIIPAYAGNTATPNTSGLRTGDHPRVCGEHGAVREPICRKTGSSPRMRGTLCRLFQSIYYTGIIPAYAGNTDLHARDVMHVRDHPRVCGEHIERAQFDGVGVGSSPRMRGTRAPQIDMQWVQGIIPAYAGNTQDTIELRTFDWDHPRVCGEHGSRSTDCDTPVGSSPRMRGTLVNRVHPLTVFRIIPAYAGNTRTSNHLTCGAWDHPRVCGEHVVVHRIQSFFEGSSPRMRGTRHVVIFEHLRTGIIPAYAGNTLRRMSRRESSGDHPRVCGEHARAGAWPVRTAGSSPRMRGTRLGRLRGQSP